MTKIEAEHINRQKSSKRGFWGVFETLLRKIHDLSFLLFMLPLVLIYTISLGLAITPGLYLFQLAQEIAPVEGVLHYLLPALAIGFGAIAFIIALLLVVPIFNFPLIPFVRAYRGPWFSLESVPWFYHNALFYLVRYTVLNLVTPSPLAIFFLKAMGMKIGKGSLINSANISDPCLIEIGDHVTIGGSVYMMAHYGMKGFLIIDKLTIQRKANIGLHAYLMGSVEVGEGAQIYGNTMVLPKTIIPAHSRFGQDQAKIIPPNPDL